jgi:hypothetical protein
VKDLKCVPTTHEKCLYNRRDEHDNLQMILRQVDDFSVSAPEQQACQDIIQQIGLHLTVPLNDLGIIRKFNGVNIHQTKWYIKISCEDYLLKILMQHDWLHLKASALPVPMRSDSKYQRDLETAERPTTPEAQQHIQTQAGFSFRMATGELIYALIVARMEISFAIIKLSQYSANPALIHYKALQHVFAYLNHTREDGLIYWRPRPRHDLPDIQAPVQRSLLHNSIPVYPQPPLSLLAYSDSDWGSDTTHRRSVSGTIIILSGAAVLYSTKFQKAIALSSTEAEFVSASDAGKHALYLRSILTDLGYTQSDPTTLLIDNTGAVFMVDAQAPTRRTRHVDIRYFALLQWSETGQVKAKSIPTASNISDSMTKPTGRIKFHQHADLFMGRTPPTYVPPEALQPETITCIQWLQPHPLALHTLSALYNPIFTAFSFDTSDLDCTEHGRVRGYSS